MEINNGAGSATNAGINYQQRISAVFVLACLFKTEISLFFNSNKFNDKIINSMQLEGIDKIDDLIITLEHQEKLFCQIKRKVNLSESKSSDFYKTIDQFIQQYLNNSINENYCLITTSYSSSKITRELAKLTESVRLNDLAFLENPLNKSEKNTLDKYKKVVKKIYKFYTKQNMSDEEFVKFSKKVFINNFDIESNSPLEKTILILIHTNTIVTPLILWETMISKCLMYASQRMTLSYENLYKEYKNNLKKDTQKKSVNSLFELTFKNNMASGKEVILCRSNQKLLDIFGSNELIDYVIIELYRFDIKCNKKVIFHNGQCIFSNGLTLEVIVRASSNERIESFMIKHKEIFEKSSIQIIPAKGIDYVEHTPCVKNYSNKLALEFESIDESFICIECGKAISENHSYIVEIDEIDLPHEVGLIHNSCIRPSIRILGQIEHEFFQKYNISDRFDWKSWNNKINNGQGVLQNTLISNNSDKKITIAWNTSLDYIHQYNFCIKRYLEDNTIEYVLKRGQVERFSKKDAHDLVSQLNTLLIQKEKEKDYLCISLKEKLFGTYKLLKSNIDFDDKLIKIKKFELEKLTKRIINENKTIGYHYAPLIFITIGENQDFFSINNMVVLLSEPSEFNKYIENWKNANIDLNEIELLIIEDDKHFDDFMNKVFEEYLGAIINPQFNLDGELIKGIEIEKFENISISTEKEI